MERDKLNETVPFAPGSDEPAATYGRFVPRGVIGRGGMGIVLRANDPELDRDVALKLLRPTHWSGTAESLGTQRLQHEAQAMAKLSHPNVVTVYEMGSVGDTRFIAMELVDGTTLRDWLARAARRWREIVAAFVQCGRGLAAAHDAGLVHRDFKPENVLVGSDGRPRVADFGLVATGVSIDDGDLATVDLGSELTVRGANVGTPAYMAPEQWTGGEVDARTDQFAFCVALWEALFGERPYAGTVGGELRDHVLAGVTRDAPRGRPVPRALVTMLRRGLARDRDARWPSMVELLARLEAAGRHRATYAMAGLGLAVSVGTIAFVMMASRGEHDSCPAPTERLAGVWEIGTRARIAASIAASGTPDAAQAPRLAASLDAYAAQWLSGSVAACRAAPTHSPELRDRRAICLERGRTALGALTTTLVGATRATIERADLAVSRLPDLAVCDDLEHLQGALALPADPAVRARIDKVYAQLDQIEAHRLRGDHAAGLAAARAAVAEARELSYAPVLAAALNRLGAVSNDRQDLAAADAAYREAASTAADGRDDLAAADAWVSVLYIAGARNEKLDAAAALDPVADAAVRRAGDPPHLRFAYLMASGALAARRNDLGTAFTRFDAGVRASGANARRRGQAMRNLARVTWQRDGAAKAIETAAEAAAITEQALGGDHLETADALYVRGQITNAAGRARAALPLIERALAIRERTFGPDALALANPHEALGNIMSNLGDLKAARAHFDRAISLKDKHQVPPASRATSLAALATMLQHGGQPADALPYYHRALALLAAASGTETIDYLMISSNLAGSLLALDRCGDARPIIDSIAPRLKQHPALYPELLVTIGGCARKRSAGAAVPVFEEAVALCVANACPPMMIATLRLELGTAIYDAGDRARGIALVREARVAANAEDPKSELPATAEAWLRAHPK